MPSHFLTIHGHFYQPPRENPWLEAVETQDSAAPYHDWNQRITAECYGPNASARILDSRDRIVKIVNNYASLSFNFGPTLLSWMKSEAASEYAAILEADRMSVERFGGHGSAIAQAYNHIIMPLASERDQRTQVRWGIRDFVRRFGRRPEGMWLPETAVDVASLEALAAEGIGFTILEPHQIRRFRAIGSAEWIDANGGVDITRPYLCKLPSGRSIELFVYDGSISRGVAFEHLLVRGENFASRLLGAFSNQRDDAQIVNIATDGETYGHHHRYGEMGLAFAVECINAGGSAQIVSYGKFLELHPPDHEAEIVENTSWSCAHGIERWRSDCGCSTHAEAGWNQRWRAPLRAALDWLRDQAAAIFEHAAAGLLHDPWDARDDYIDVVLDRSDDRVNAFLLKHGTRGSGDESPQQAAIDTRILELLEMQRNAMLMYTSCGWFFNDISGIETVQVLHYAGRVLQLAERVSGLTLTPEFLTRVAEAKSNLPEKGDARQIYEREVVPTMIDLGRVAAHYAAASLFDHAAAEGRVYCYTIEQRDFETVRSGRAKMAIGSITITSIITRESAAFDFAVLHIGETELTGGVRPASSPEAYELLKEQLANGLRSDGIPSVIRVLDHAFVGSPVAIRSLFRDEQRRILTLLCDATLAEAESTFRQLHERYDPLMRFHSSLGVPLPQVLQTAAAFDLNTQIRKALLSEEVPLAQLEPLLREARSEGVSLDDTTRLALRNALVKLSSALRQKPDDADLLDTLCAIVTLLRSTQVAVDLRAPQNDYYRMKQAVRPQVAAHASNGSPSAMEWLNRFDALGESLSFSPEAPPEASSEAPPEAKG
ncbi:MAG TPA: DUF3536 domain-containing protein [Thermoanaerobaculia bacterium]|nr:DUF3536 domain-containing protein [Thermoanaerobaculia bacterium]